MIMISRLIQIFFIGSCSLLLAGLISCNFRLYKAPPPAGKLAPEIPAQLRFYRDQLDQGMGAEMQQLFPEGYFFSYALYGLSWVNVGLHYPEKSQQREEALAEARWAKQFLDSPAGKAAFPPNLTPPNGMFYAAWRNYLLAGILLLQPSNELNQAEATAFKGESDTIAQAIAGSSTPFLPSYNGQAWPVDTLPAILSLRVHSRLIDDQHEPIIAEWLADAQNLLDPSTQLIPHRTHYQTGTMQDGSRATSQTLILRFLAEIEPDLAQRHYAQFRQRYIVTRFGLPGALEFPPPRIGVGDIDSGPLLQGVSLSATAVLLGTAHLFGDDELRAAIWQGGEALGNAVAINGKRRYALGIMPIGDAFVIWSKTTIPWLTQPKSQPYDPIMSWWWRFPFHFASILVGAAPALFLIFQMRR